jgi:HD-like signal output (HDOD) protein
MKLSYSDLSVADLLKGDLRLASPPNIYFALKKIIDDPAKGPKDAAHLIEDDAVLSLKLLKIVNSAFYGFPSQITSIAKAINIIGSSELQNLVLGTLIIERFSNLPAQHFSIYDFWSRNLRCALLTRELDRELGCKYADCAFVCGLIHNIGQLLFYLRIPVLARQVEMLLQSQTRMDSFQLIEIERQVIGFDHFQAGAELCRLWKLPEVIIESIELHTAFDRTGGFSDIATMVRLADAFSSLENCNHDVMAADLALPPQLLNVILEKVGEEFESVFKIFYPAH